MKRKEGPRSSYQLVNFILGTIIGCIFLYFAIFSSANTPYPISSLFTKITGLPSISTGLSQSFSAMLRGNWTQAKQFNPFGPGIFFFFAIQLLFRGALFTLINYNFPKIKTLILVDVSLSVLAFLLAFRGFIIFTMKLAAFVIQQL